MPSRPERLSLDIAHTEGFRVQALARLIREDLRDRPDLEPTIKAFNQAAEKAARDSTGETQLRFRNLIMWLFLYFQAVDKKRARATDQELTADDYEEASKYMDNIQNIIKDRTSTGLRELSYLVTILLVAVLEKVDRQSKEPK